MPKGIYKRTKQMMTGRHTPWNKGKIGVYKHSPETLAKLRHDGMLGKRHKPETINLMREKAINGSYAFKPGFKHTQEFKQLISNKNKGKMPSNLGVEGKSFGNIKRGWYNINGKKMFFRSMWEVNYAIYLDWLKKIGQIKDWEYESDVFVFHKIQFGTRSYRPDFKITNNDGSFHYDEVKGWMDSESATKIKRMAKYYPDVKLTIIDGKEYNSIKRKVGKMLNFY